MECKKCGLSFWQAFKQGWLDRRKCDDGEPHRFKRSFAADDSTRAMSWWRSGLQLLFLAVVLWLMSGVAALLGAVGLDDRSALAGIVAWTLLVYLVGWAFGMTITIPRFQWGRTKPAEAKHD